jgi:hypothetical protein
VRQATGEGGRGRRRVGFLAARASAEAHEETATAGRRVPRLKIAWRTGAVDEGDGDGATPERALPHGPTAAGRGRAGRPTGLPPGYGSSVMVRTSCIEEG